MSPAPAGTASASAAASAPRSVRISSPQGVGSNRGRRDSDPAGDSRNRGRVDRLFSQASGSDAGAVLGPQVREIRLRVEGRTGGAPKRLLRRELAPVAVD